MLNDFSLLFSFYGQSLTIGAETAFIWAPPFLGFIFWHTWMAFVQAQYIANYKWIMLEAKLPREIFKTPLAMEMVLTALFQSGSGTWYDKIWKGKTKPWFSLEIVSSEGDVHFFIRTPAQFRKLIESNIYGQYPDIEVHEVQDYVANAPYLSQENEWTLWGGEFVLTKEDPYPIMTYVDYKLDSTQTKEEMKSDPIVSMIELFGSIGRGQQVWFQILVQATGDRFPTKGKWFKKQDWKAEGKRVVEELKKKMTATDADGKTAKGTKMEMEMDIVHAVERSLAKYGFDCGMRMLYIAQKDNFDATVIPALIGSIRQYNSLTLNGFKPTKTTDFNYPWQDPWGNRLLKKKKEIFHAYVRRSYFFAPHKRKPFVLNTEELATVFHFPGGVAETPTFSRIDSRKGEPPANLPI